MVQIVHTPSQVLTTPARKVKKFDNFVKQIIGDMKAALLQADSPKGVGLAAPQIGISLQIFLLRPTTDNPIKVCINPEIIAKSNKLQKGIPGSEGKLEGCLSIPKIWGIVNRCVWVKLKYLDESAQECIETFIDFPAIIVQHEMDHLMGILFTKRVVEQKGKLYKASENEKGEETLELLDL